MTDLQSPPLTEVWCPCDEMANVCPQTMHVAPVSRGHQEDELAHAHSSPNPSGCVCILFLFVHSVCVCAFMLASLRLCVHACTCAMVHVCHGQRTTFVEV